jgi:hypothetical protein
MSNILLIDQLRRAAEITIANRSNHGRFRRLLMVTFNGRTETTEHKRNVVNEGKQYVLHYAASVIVQNNHVTFHNIKTTYRTATTILYEAKRGRNK